ncbi:MAG: DUF4105 domain-containing protein [Bacteroidia bacterium]|nr:DUF4105 domain-containing protein [Bacteroidia bacterium]
MHLRKILSLLLFTLAFGSMQAGHRVVPQLSSQARYYLLTCDPGTELYSSFGHSALRLYDPMNGLDQTYNYGVFNFNTPNFYLKFAQGKLLYQLSVSSYAGFLGMYQEEERKVISQELALDEGARQTLYKLLEENYLEANRYYAYDFFFDNCSSRIRDMLEKSLGQRLVWKEIGKDDQRTFRQLIQPYLDESPWADFGIDLGLGLPTDRRADARMQMFLPRYLMEGFAAASLDGKSLIAAESVVVLPRRELFAPPFPVSPSLLTWGIFALLAALTAFQFKRKKTRYGWDFLWFFLLGLTGLVVTLLWFATNHGATQYNLNFLWAFPFHLIAVFILIRKRKPAWIFTYFGVLAGLNLLLLISWPIFPQAYHTAFIPLILGGALRGAWIWYFNRSVQPE